MKPNCPGIPPRSCIERCGRDYCSRWRYPAQYTQGPHPIAGHPGIVGLSCTPDEERAYRAARFGPISRSEASRFSRADLYAKKHGGQAPFFTYTIGGPDRYVTVAEFRATFGLDTAPNIVYTMRSERNRNRYKEKQMCNNDGTLCDGNCATCPPDTTWCAAARAADATDKRCPQCGGMMTHSDDMDDPFSGGSDKKPFWQCEDCGLTIDAR
jgi:hypothetical protein